MHPARIDDIIQLRKMQVQLAETRATMGEELRLWKKEIEQKTDAAKQREGFQKFVTEQQQRQLAQSQREAALFAEDPAVLRASAGTCVCMCVYVCVFYVYVFMCVCICCSFFDTACAPAATEIAVLLCHASRSSLL